jgi:hypothetical protein
LSRLVGPASAFVRVATNLFLDVDRLWTVTFSVGIKNTIGRSESQWLLSFGLGEHSVPAWVDGDFLVLRRLAATERGDNYEPTFSLPLGHNPSKLQPGPENAIKIRLDEGPMRPHLLNECVHTHLSYLFHLLTRHSTGHWHWLITMEPCTPNLLSGSLKLGAGVYPLSAPIFLTVQV